MEKGTEQREKRELAAETSEGAQTKPAPVSSPQSGLRELVNRAEVGGWRLPADGWYQLAPLGEFAQAEASVVQVIDREAVARMAARNKEGPLNILVDYDHFSFSPSGSSEAAGWIVGLEAREDGLWGQIRWTPEGEAAVQNGRYRYLSPAWRVEDCEECPDRTAPGEPADAAQPLPPNRVTGAWKRVRPVRLYSVGLTNCPNLKGLAALSNRASGAAAGEVELQTQAPGENKPPAEGVGSSVIKETKPMMRLLSELGLGADASEETALAAVKALKKRASEPSAPPLHNRAAAGRPEFGRTALERSAAERQRAEVLAYKNRQKCTFDEAWQAVKLERPELFCQVTSAE